MELQTLKTASGSVSKDFQYSAQTWEDLRRPTPRWYEDTPLGFFVHWGAYSLPGWAEDHGELGTEPDWGKWFTHNSYAEWYYNTIRIEGSPAQLRHRELYGNLDYDSFLDMWDVSGWNPKKWTELFKKAGGDYAVLTTKHHDGITLWDAPETGSRNTVRRGPHRDLVGEFAEAVRAEGMHVGVYYSGGLDWHYRPYPPIVTEEQCLDLFRPKDAAYARYCFVQSKDLIDRYRPDVFWNDIDWPDEGKNFSDYGLGRLMEYFYHVCPDGVTNDRYGGMHADFMTSEYQHFGAAELAPVWENCRGVGLSFGYNRAEGVQQYLDGPAAVRHLLNVVCKGGRLLLNVGPKADGSLPDEQILALEGLAEFMQPHKAELIGGNVPKRVPASDGWARVIMHEDHAALFVDASAFSVGDLPEGYDWSRCVSARAHCTYEDGRIRVEAPEGIPSVVCAPKN